MSLLSTIYRHAVHFVSFARDCSFLLYCHCRCCCCCEERRKVEIGPFHSRSFMTQDEQIGVQFDNKAADNCETNRESAKTNSKLAAVPKTAKKAKSQGGAKKSVAKRQSSNKKKVTVSKKGGVSKKQKIGGGKAKNLKRVKSGNAKGKKSSKKSAK